MENAAFKALLHVLRPDYTPPTVFTLKQMIGATYIKCQTALATLLPSSASSCWYGLTFDMWTGPHNYGILGFTIHWIINFTLQSRILGVIHFIGSHTANIISERITEMLDSWKISSSSISGATIDSGSNGKKATKLRNMTDLSCFCHTLQSTILDGLAKVNMNTKIETIRSLVSMISRSTKASDKLREFANELKLDKWKVY